MAAEIRKDGVLSDFIKHRYRSWDSGIGHEIESGRATFESLDAYITGRGDAATNESGRQEMLENIFNRYL
jgi:xylose isomerase